MSKGIARDIALDIKRIRQELGRVPSLSEYLSNGGYFNESTIKLAFNGGWAQATRAAGQMKEEVKEEPREPKVLFLDIETSLMLVDTFRIWDTTLRPDDIVRDWELVCWAAMWLDSNEVMFSGFGNEKRALKRMWALMDEADIIITQHGTGFDQPKLNARFIIQGLGPYSPVDHTDTKKMAKKFGFSSHSLGYMCKVLKTKHQKLEHGKFPGKELWRQVEKRNPEALAEMELYNKTDVLCLRDVWEKLRVWGDPHSFNPYRGEAIYKCNCGSSNLIKEGFKTQKTGKFQRYKCRDCGSWHLASGQKNNLFSERKKLSLKP